jgi:hypothetical protein
MITSAGHELHCVLHLRDRRAPHELQADLERRILAPLTPALEAGRLSFSGTMDQSGSPFWFLLRFDAATAWTNHYTLRIRTSWADQPDDRHEASRRSAEGWIGLWTGSYAVEAAPSPSGSAERYARLAEEALAAEAALTDVPTIQRAVLDAVRAGATPSTAHKEGGTILRWNGRRFERSDYGEWTAHETFTDDAAFLAFLRRFWDWETTRHAAPAKPTETVVWRLILRRTNATGAGGTP